jgi:hypothetical protein
MSKGRSKHKLQQHSPPHISSSRQDNEQTASPQKTSEQKNAGSLIDTTSVSRRAEIPPPPGNPQEPEHAWYQAIQRWKPLLEIVGVFFAIGYAIVTFFQWRDARRSLELDERAWIAPTGTCAESFDNRAMRAEDCGKYNVTNLINLSSSLVSCQWLILSFRSIRTSSVTRIIFRTLAARLQRKRIAVTVATKPSFLKSFGTLEEKEQGREDCLN